MNYILRCHVLVQFLSLHFSFRRNLAHIGVAKGETTKTVKQEEIKYGQELACRGFGLRRKSVMGGTWS